MSKKEKYIEALEDAIDFITHNVDGAAPEHQERETLKTLREMSRRLKETKPKTTIVNLFKEKK